MHRYLLGRLRLLPLVALIATTAAPAGTDEEALREAIRNNDSAVLSRAVEETGRIDYAAGDGKTILMAAAAADDTALVNLLLARGADVNGHNNRGGTALMYAAASGSEKTATRLLDAGAVFNDRAENGWTALTLAAAKGHAGLVSLLLAAGADPDIPDVFGFTPLMRAIQNRRIESARALLSDQRTEVLKANIVGISAYDLALEVGNCELARRLLDAAAERGEPPPSQTDSDEGRCGR